VYLSAVHEPTSHFDEWCAKKLDLGLYIIVGTTLTHSNIYFQPCTPVSS
jgi:hypothetical protein